MSDMFPVLWALWEGSYRGKDRAISRVKLAKLLKMPTKSVERSVMELERAGVRIGRTGWGYYWPKKATKRGP